MSGIDVASADRLLTTTRGVRRRIDFDRPVDPSIIEECIDIAMQAPVGSSWIAHFIAVSDAKKRKVIGDWYTKAADPYLDDLAAKLRERSKSPQESSAAEKALQMHRWYTDNLHRAPVLMIIAMQGRYESEPTAKVAAVYGSNLPVAWSFMLALRARGLGTCWTTLHIYHEREIAESLGIPDDVTQTVLLPIGYYKGADFKRAARPKPEGFVHWNRW